MIVQDINLHPSSDMLLKYSMGNTTEAESLIISCHIAYCSECKNEIKKYTHAQSVVCVNSWTSGAMLMLRWFGVGPGDEVIIPAPYWVINT